MVTAPHALAAEIGAGVLAEGGSAADAAVAIGAALAVVYPHMTGVGGDAFWLFYDAPGGVTTAYNGSGAAAAMADPEYYRRLHGASIPVRGPAAALTVPGAVDAWFAIHERFGKLEIARLLAPAIACARDGVALAPSVARSMLEERSWLVRDDGARAVYTGVAGRLVQPALARTLSMIAAHGRRWFYEGEAAAAISAWAQRAGSPLRLEDFAEHRGQFADPASGSFAGFDSLVTPPNSQGVTLIAAQQIFEEFVGAAVLADNSAELVHAAIEAAKLAYAGRDRWIADSGDDAPALTEFVSPAYAAQQAARLRWDRALSASAETGDGGTTYFACVDAVGNAASYIQSLYHHFGAAVVVPALGIALQNRGSAFSLDEGNVRKLIPKRRPFHTLMAAMLSSKGEPRVVYGSMGGDAQPQIALGLAIRMARLAQDPQAAISAPRWRWFNSAGKNGRVAIEPRIGEACLRGLRARGHALETLGDWEESMGHAGAVAIDRAGGRLLGGADPRGDGAAVGI